MFVAILFHSCVCVARLAMFVRVLHVLHCLFACLLRSCFTVVLVLRDWRRLCACCMLSTVCLHVCCDLASRLCLCLCCVIGDVRARAVCGCLVGSGCAQFASFCWSGCVSCAHLCFFGSAPGHPGVDVLEAGTDRNTGTGVPLDGGRVSSAPDWVDWLQAGFHRVLTTPNFVLVAW